MIVRPNLDDSGPILIDLTFLDRECCVLGGLLNCVDKQETVD